MDGNSVSLEMIGLKNHTSDGFTMSYHRRSLPAIQGPLKLNGISPLLNVCPGHNTAEGLHLQPQVDADDDHANHELDAPDQVNEVVLGQLA